MTLYDQIISMLAAPEPYDRFEMIEELEYYDMTEFEAIEAVDTLGESIKDE